MMPSTHFSPILKKKKKKMAAIKAERRIPNIRLLVSDIQVVFQWNKYLANDKLMFIPYIFLLHGICFTLWVMQVLQNLILAFNKDF